MLLLNDKLSVKTLMSGQTAFLTMAEAFKKKDYNKIANRLRAYHALASFLQAPPLSEIQQLHNIHSSLRNLDHTLNEIQLSVDEMGEDALALGFVNFSEAFEGVVQIFKVMHEYLSKTVRQNIYLYHADSLKPHKNITNICAECQQNHEATHLKRLKTEFGMIYPDTVEDESSPAYIKRMEEKQDLALKQKEDFIDQINLLLEKKDKMINIPVNTRRYKDLVDCLSKMQELNIKIQDNELEHANHLDVGDLDTEDKMILQAKYKKILDEVKQILNSKFRQGYSSRIQTMLDRFEIVLKSEKAKKTEKKIYVNVQDAQVQTQIILSEETQIKMIKDDLDKKQIELVSLKQGRAKIEDKYIKLLQSERRMSKDLSALNLKTQKMQNQIHEKDRHVKNLKQEIIKIRQYEFDSTRMYQTSNLPSYSQQLNKSIDFSRSNKQKSASNKSSCHIKTTKTIEDCISQYTQTDPNPVEEDLTQTQRSDSKKKLIKLLRRSSSFNVDSLLLMRGNSDISQTQGSTKKKELSIFSPSMEVVISSNSILNQDNFNFQLYEANSSKQSKLKKIGIQNKRQKTRQATDKYLDHAQQIQQRVEEDEEQPVQILKKPASKKDKQRYSQRKMPDLDSNSIRKKNKKPSLVAQQQIQTNIKKEEMKASREFKNINSIRLTELPFSKTFRLKTRNNEQSKSKEIPHHSVTREKQKEGIVHINKYEKKDSGTMDKLKVKEILALLKVQKDSSFMKSYKNGEASMDLLQVPKDRQDALSAESKSFDGELNQNKAQQQRNSNYLYQAKINVAQTIQQLKNLIQAQYTYLKATGFIDYLLVMEKKPSQINRNLIKYKFQFSHLIQGDLNLFGGAEQMVRFSNGLGIWQRYIEEEHDLKLYFKHINFAHKISKYFILLKKMNPEYFQEYTAFIIDPLGFSISHFNPLTVDTINEYMKSIECPKEKVVQNRCHEINWKRMMMRLIRFHHEVHKNCQHMVEFLQKIGYYRYSI